ncbi:putative disco-interacting protein 2-like C [Apostichopus japonicus]|uniref:Putative disco-interacting protein 2-like C n=1 Tax=Stichopus japonicus TaxID=307972 RepID=A0A2G8LL43_STIJA|nr:putative disco-interacting protein 2-like C [Apostichopus japonicus]
MVVSLFFSPCSTIGGSVYPNSDPAAFVSAFYGCLFAGVVPVAIDVPLSRKDAGGQQIGFLLGSCGITVALTSNTCLKELPKNQAGEVVRFKGWPRLNWQVTESLPKSQGMAAPPRMSEDSPAYIEYTTDKDGIIKGVTITRKAMLYHCRTLTVACSYQEAEIMVNVLDFKRDVGLWHSMQASIFNGMHVICVPYSLMKVNPASWMQMVTKYKASLAIVKSRDMHWGLMAQKEHKDLNFKTLRMLLVADGANPWSLSSCDAFLTTFQGKGLKSEVMCPCACATEALTVSIRRPGKTGSTASGRGVLSMAGLSYGVVRVDTDDKLTSLTLQDVGVVMPGAAMVVVKITGKPYLCQTDEIGELCVSSEAVGSSYWGLKGKTSAIFSINPLKDDDEPVSDQPFIKTGLLGFLGPGGLVFVCGNTNGLMQVSDRRHNTDDIIATVLAVEPMKFIYRGRIAVFSIKVLRDERVVVIAEQRPEASEEECFQWMSRVLQAIDSIHQLGVYCLCLVNPNSLPKKVGRVVSVWEKESKLYSFVGHLLVASTYQIPNRDSWKVVCTPPMSSCVPTPVSLTCQAPYQTVRCRAASIMMGNLVAARGSRAAGRDIGRPDEDSDAAKRYQFLSEVLRWRANSTPDHVLFQQLNNKGSVSQSLSCLQLHKRAERVGVLLQEKCHINTGDHVALIFPPGTDLIVAFYGCLYVGAVPVTVRPPHPQNLVTTLPTVRMIVEVSKSVVVLSTAAIIKLLRSKEATGTVDVKTWPPLLDTDDLPKKKLTNIYRAPTPEMLCYLDFSVSTTGMLAGVKMSHSASSAACRSLKLSCELYPSRVVCLCLDPYCGLGFVLWVLSSLSLYLHWRLNLILLVVVCPQSVQRNSQRSFLKKAMDPKRGYGTVRDTFCSYSVMEICTKGLGQSVVSLKTKGINLSAVRYCVAVAEERPRTNLTNSFSKLFLTLGLSPRAVSTAFGCRINVAIALQLLIVSKLSVSSHFNRARPPAIVYVDMRALRNDRVTIVEKGSPQSLCMMESGKILPGVKVVIAHPDTRGQCAGPHLGEIWVHSPHNSCGYFTIYGDDPMQNDHFTARLTTGDVDTMYARTGYLDSSRGQI